MACFMADGVSPDSTRCSTAATPSRLDGTLQCTLSPTNGEGSASMQTLVEQHMTSILRPAGQHVSELQKQVAQLQEAVQTIQAEKCTPRIDALDAGMLELRGSVQDLAGRFDVVFVQLNDLSARHHELHKGLQGLVAEHAMTKIALEKVDDQQKTQEAAMHAEKETATGLRSVLSALETRTVDLKTTLDGVQPVLDRLDSEIIDVRRSHIGVCERHIALSRSHDAVLKDCGTLHSDVRDLHIKIDEHQTKVTPMFDELRGRADNVERDVRVAQSDLLDLASSLKVEAGRVEKLQVSAIALRRGIDAVEASKLDKNLLHDAVGGLRPRLLDLEEGMADLSKRLEAEVDKNPLSLAQDLVQHLNGTVASVERQGHVIASLDERQKQHTMQLHCLDMRTRDLAKEDQMLGTWVDVADAHLSRLVKSKQVVDTTLDAHSRVLDRVRVQQEEAKVSVSQATLNLRNLHSTVGAQNETLAKFSARLELAHEYVDGLGKGLQDTHQQVLAGTGGLLAPKPSPGRMLPEIGGRVPPGPQAN